VTGGPENAFFAEASAALGRFYRLPSASWASTEALLEDEQAGLEKMFALASHVRAGVELVWGLGQLESEMTLSLAQLVIDDEMVAFVRRHQRGFDASDEELAVELTRQVGVGGTFLETEHTLNRCRSEIHHPRLLSRVARRGPVRPLHEVAGERVRSLLEAPSEPALGDHERSELRAIEARFRSE